ncbi:DUF6804 family protein [Pseudoxanthomonas broegbernensis]|uniref:DUF6804 family protein n=1 Tax=Pseudoxanthomonas broegbernensis TaxID=83619 RepID=UPI001390C0C1|nr:DUF6804 family protein [Pseudoxanthomonas broegbernensis]MBB6066265.1 hypothetical protein [Pseudoxanthomonas broegbernensis]
MLTKTTEPRVCRACTRIIGSGTVISLVRDKHPYHTFCSPLPEDASYKHRPLPPPDRSAEPLKTDAETTPDVSSPSAWQRLIPHAIVGLLLLFALFPDNEIGYYRVMRWIVCAAFTYMAVAAHFQKRESWVWIWGVAAGIYNPIIPVEASREIWSVVNLASIGLIAFDGIGGARTIGCATRATGRFARTALHFILRLALAIIMIVVLLLAFNFVITHLA